MMSTTQRQALAVLAELCELSLDVRLGQLMAILGLLGEDETGRTLWDLDDEQLLAVMYRHRAELVARTDQRADQVLPLTGGKSSTENLGPQAQDEPNKPLMGADKR